MYVICRAPRIAPLIGATSYGLDGGGSIPGKNKGFLSSAHYPDQIRCPLTSIQWVSWAPSLDESGRGVKLTTRLQLMPRSRMVKLFFHSPVSLHFLVLN
jgi:hypothetical protein